MLEEVPCEANPYRPVLNIPGEEGAREHTEHVGYRPYN
jgi:hypothetical protein